MEPETRPAASRRLRLAAFAAAALGLAAAAFSAREQALTIDEPYHLAYSRRLLLDGESDRRSELHFDSKTPVVVANVAARRAARDWLGAEDPRLLRLAARLPTVAWFGLLVVLTALVASRLAGPDAGALAAMAVALDPNLIAHASLATVDVAYALATLASLAAAWRFARAPGAGWGAALGLALAFAFACKFSAPLLLAGVAVAAARALVPGNDARPRWRATAAGLLSLALVFCAATCASYLFLEVGRPLGALELRSRFLGALAGAFPGLRLPLPAAFLTGLDAVSRMEATKEFPVLVLDQRYPRGVFFYFAVCWALKTPLALLAFQLAGFAALARDRTLARSGELRFQLFNLGLTLIFFSFFFRTQVGYRFVLMCLPLAAVVGGAALARRLPAPHVEALALGLLVLCVAEQLPYLGNHLAFTNAFVQPKRDAFRLLSDSNLDWGQNDDKLDGWLRENGRAGTPVNPPNPLPGENVYQVLVLGSPRFDWIRRNLRPVEHFRHSFLLFRLSAADFRRYLADERRFEPDARAAAACSNRPRHPPAADERIVTERAAASMLVCLEASGALEIGLESERGSALFGPLGRPRKLWDMVGPGQVSYLRLEPGLHAFGVDRGFGFTARLRAPTDGLLWSFTRGSLPEVGELADAAGRDAPSGRGAARE
ncbi:MAG: glycosyltransferase family 39 protein [Vicinamibacteria bacterium]